MTSQQAGLGENRYRWQGRPAQRGRPANGPGGWRTNREKVGDGRRPVHKADRLFCTRRPAGISWPAQESGDTIGLVTAAETISRAALSEPGSNRFSP